MKILSASQVYAADQYTMAHEPISSTDLMERAASKCVDWILAHLVGDKQIVVFCGSGNNGGDGLVISRLLHQKGLKVQTAIVSFSPRGSSDFIINLQRLETSGAVAVPCSDISDFPLIPDNCIVVDALFGLGLSRPPEGIVVEAIRHINASRAMVVSIDFPSGMYAEQSSVGHDVVQADYTLSFQVPKLAFVMPENAHRVGQLKILDIGLSAEFIARQTGGEVIDKKWAKKHYRTRTTFSHKGSFGHSLLIGGSYGKVGAMVLAAGGALRCGSGLVSVAAPRCAYSILQAAVPEAMVRPVAETDQEYLSCRPHIDGADAIAVGPGLDILDETAHMLGTLLRTAEVPLLLDADALNILSLRPDLLAYLPENSVLTPHPGELKRLVGDYEDDFKRHAALLEFAQRHKVVVLLKGAYSRIALPSGQFMVNTSGNPALATGGSGDVLSGMICALLAQGYSAPVAAGLGAWLHGSSADHAVRSGLRSMESFVAGDIGKFLGDAFMALK